MATFVYYCGHCNITIEQDHFNIAAEPPPYSTTCPACRGEALRFYTVPNIQGETTAKPTGGGGLHIEEDTDGDSDSEE